MTFSDWYYTFSGRVGVQIYGNYIMEKIKKNFKYDVTIKFREQMGPELERYECEIPENKIHKFLQSIQCVGKPTCIHSISADVLANRSSYLVCSEGYPLYFNHSGKGTAEITVELKPFGCICGMEECVERIISGKCLDTKVEQTFNRFIFENDHTKGR